MFTLKTMLIVCASTAALNAVAAENKALTPAKEGIAGKSVLAISVNELDAVTTGYSAKKMILGKKIYNGVDSKPIGVVRDLIVTLDKSISYAVVDVGGFLGLGEKQVIVPAASFKMEDGKIVVADASKETLKALPEFHYAR